MQCKLVNWKLKGPNKNSKLNKIELHIIFQTKEMNKHA